MIMNNVDRAAEIRNAGLTDTLHDVVEMLTADGLTPRLMDRTSLADEYGNNVHLSITADDLTVEVEYVFSQSVETFHLDPYGDTERVARIILAAIAPID